MNSNLSLQQEIEEEANLSVLPPGVSHLLKTLTNDDISYDNLTTELEKFPSIALKIVSMANSSWASPIAPITSLHDSCSRIGLQLIRSTSIALSVSQLFNPGLCPSFDQQKFWLSALLTAEAAHLCAKDTDDVCPDTARLAGLLHNMGLLWLAENKPIETSDAIDIGLSNNVSFQQILSEQYNYDIYAIGGILATALELPEITVRTIASSSTNTTIHTDPLINNHRYAQQLASSVLLYSAHSDINNADIETDYSDDNPKFMQLAEKLSDIQSMAKILFFN